MRISIGKDERSILYWQTWRTLINQVDAALPLAARQAQLNIGRSANRLDLRIQTGADSRRLQDNFIFSSWCRMAPSGSS